MNKKVKKIKEKMEKEGMEVVLGRWQFEMMGMEFILNLREVEERYFEEKKVFVGNCSIATPIGNDYKGTFRLEETSKKENCRFFDFNLHALSTFFAFLLEVPLKSEEPSLASSSLFLHFSPVSPSSRPVLPEQTIRCEMKKVSEEDFEAKDLESQVAPEQVLREYLNELQTKLQEIENVVTGEPNKEGVAYQRGAMKNRSNFSGQFSENEL